MDKRQLKYRAEYAHHRLKQHGTAAGAAWAAIATNPAVAVSRVVEQQRAAHTAAQVTADELSAQERAALDDFDRQYVSGLPPVTFEPRDYAHSQRATLFASAIAAGQINPHVLAGQIHALIAQGDAYALWVAAPYLESGMLFRSVYMQSSELSGAIVDAAAFLESTPELTTRREDRGWLEGARSDAKYLREVVTAPDPRERLTLAESLGAMPTLGAAAPEVTPATFGIENAAPTPAPR